MTTRVWPLLAASALACVAGVAAPGVAAADPATTGSVSSVDSVVVGGPRLAAPGIVVDTSPGVPALPQITATSFVIADADTGAILAASNAHEKLAPASTLKTLTAVTLLPRLSPDLTTVAQRDAPSVDGTKAGIVAGATYTVRDLFTAMLMMSANDAAVALADANGGLAPTLVQMNAEAKTLRADDTVAKTPNGLDAPGQSSSAYDLALIFRAGMQNPDFRHYLSLSRAAFPAPHGSSYQIQTHDDLLTKYPGMVGGKNGYTIAAHASYVGEAARGGHTIIIAMMRDQPNFWNEAASLLNWGFAADGVAAPVGQLVDPLPSATSGQPVASTPPATAAPAVPAAVPAAAPAPAAAAAAAGDVAAAAPTSRAQTTAAARKRPAGGHANAASSGGVSVSDVVMWTAVGLGALVFLAALARLAARRRRSYGGDERYLSGLSRLSELERISDGR